MLCFASPQPSVSRLALLHMSKFGSVTEADQGLFFLGYSQSCRSSITINIRTLSSPQRKPYTRYQSLPISSQTSPSVCVCVCVKLVTQLCLTLWDPMDCSPPGSSVHGILQARTLEWVAMPSSRGSSRPRDRTWIFCIAGRFFTVWATGEASSN